ncbi:MAG: TRAP transporter small permease [Marinovum algicola]|uniref:TRAP transporter small permease protein n=1 Tax=Marinovum algicola TaxID=42444 RepID=A0A975W6F5_9RHOB|nr:MULTISPECIES: TRAP transporter small permease [Marinovum]AKO95943.1 TRAP-type C4-dicarboxylate transport system, small permease component [Marinovum algicola DG 898]MDD9742710.1 TRAP transporter small permease [Marinovum sp. PR37]SEI59212.1 TRAP-type C4-dicarboxylate transport system, small permease component [Marinovum algicola]SLN27197.1 2,3-diketo-L-gulonate TRAP transporter small permease protein YiaM [Marinovum algicola]
MQNLAKWVRRAENLVSFTALAVLTGSVLWGVLTRYVTERPAVWTTELSGILFTWVVFIGAMTAHQEGRHIRVTLLIDLLPAAARRALRKLADGLVLAFLAYAAWLSFVMMQKGATRPSPVLDIPFSWVYLATLLAFVGMSLTSALRLLGLMDPPPVDALEDVV